MEDKVSFDNGDVFFKFTGRDTYRAVKQFIKNGLGLSKGDIENEIKAAAFEYASKAIENYSVPNAFRDAIESRITSALRSVRAYSSWDSVILSMIEKAIEKEVKEQVDKIIKERIAVTIRQEGL